MPSIVEKGKLRTGRGRKRLELVAELGQVSKSLVYRDHSCGLAEGQDGMAHGCLSSVSQI